MYAWLWRRLPGNVAVKAVLALALIAVVVWLLFEQVFPWADPRLPFNQVTLDTTSRV
jgi:hypothetical protein